KHDSFSAEEANYEQACIYANHSVREIFATPPVSHVLGLVENPKRVSFFGKDKVYWLVNPGSNNGYAPLKEAEFPLREELFSPRTGWNEVGFSPLPELNDPLSELAGSSPLKDFKKTVKGALLKASKKGSTWGFGALFEQDKFDESGVNTPRTSVYYEKKESVESVKEMSEHFKNIWEELKESEKEYEEIYQGLVDSNPEINTESFLNAVISILLDIKKDISTPDTTYHIPAFGLYFAKARKKQISNLITVIINVLWEAKDQFSDWNFIQYRHFSSVAHLYSEVVSSIAAFQEQIHRTLNISFDLKNKIKKLKNGAENGAESDIEMDTETRSKTGNKHGRDMNDPGPVEPSEIWGKKWRSDDTIPSLKKLI
ncbi:MAG TPA: hypothetical protein VKO42_03055, partial [Patescibacteria group bacterium]|nr:hypothetical protein [Patescibacteria group bacterium]